MHYSYSEKSFARDLFDAAKSKLRKSFPDASATPRHWLDALNYGSNFIPFHNRIKFRSMRGIPLRIASAPLCTHDAAIIGRLPQAPSAVKPEAPPASDSEAATRPSPDRKAAARSSSEPDVNWPPHGNAEPQQKQPASRQEEPPAASQEDANRQLPSRISTPVLSTLLGLTVAIMAGIIIGNNNTSRLEFADSKHARGSMELGAGALSASGGAASSHVPRLTLDSTPPQSPPEVANSKLASGKLRQRRDEASTRSMAVKQPVKKKTHASARSTRPSSTSKEHRKSAPAPQTATARKAPARTASAIATKAVRPQLKSQSPARLGTLYARCENLRGLLRQERCRWQVCGGKWGKHGCPAYKHKSMSEMGFGQLPPSSSERTSDGG